MWDITINKFWADFQVAEALYYLATRVWLDEDMCTPSEATC